MFLATKQFYINTKFIKISVYAKMKLDFFLNSPWQVVDKPSSYFLSILNILKYFL